MDVVKVTYFDEPERWMAAAAVEKKVIELAEGIGISVDKCVWNLGLGINHTGPHRLDVHFGEYVVRIYFTDHELAGYWGMEETTLTDNRLRQLMERMSDIISALNAHASSEHLSSGMTFPDRIGHHYLKKHFRRRAK